MKAIKQNLRDRTGLDPALLGDTAIERAVRGRMRALHLGSTSDYLRLIQSSRPEWLDLIESLLITETWFFRDREPFQAFVRLVREQWLSPAHSNRPLKVLSVPCASGEEPYSIVMALLDGGFQAGQFEVHAADISPRSLARARAAVYGRNSFRGDDLRFRDRFFTCVQEGYVLEPKVRDAVRFFEGNLLSPDFRAVAQPYDFVFCRNLLIYLDPVNRARVLRKLAGILGPSGILIVGAAEQPIALEQGFASLHIPNAFACRAAGTHVASDPWSTAPPALPLEKLASNQRGMFQIPLGFPPWAGSAESSRLLEQARRLADVGQLQKARLVCEAHLKGNMTSVQGWYLLGLLRDAATDSTAIECYRRALYLNPNHYETLIQMALLSERSGDRTGAERFRSRASRVQNQAVNL